MPLKRGCIPQWQKQFVLPIDRQRYVAQWIEKMYAGGTISRCPEGLWQSPIFVVPKKTPGEYRLVTDFRRVNKQLVHEWLRSKRSTDLLKEVQVTEPALISTCDLQSAFFCIPYARENSEATEFYADCGDNVSKWGENLTGRWNLHTLLFF